MNIEEVWHKFKHLDNGLSNRDLVVGDDLSGYVLYHLWQSVKEEIENQLELPESVAEIHSIAFEREVSGG